MVLPHPASPSFPYTTLFRSLLDLGLGDHGALSPGGLGQQHLPQDQQQHGVQAVQAGQAPQQFGGVGILLALAHEGDLGVVVDDQFEELVGQARFEDRKSTRLNSSHVAISYAVFCLKKKTELVLLDVIMPDMDGIEVCQRLEAYEDTRSIPSIFITVRTNKESKIEGMAVGTVEYITT